MSFAHILTHLLRAAPYARHCRAPAEHGDTAGERNPPAGLQLQALAVDELLTRNHDLIGRIKLADGSDSATFVRELLPLIRAYLAYVNTLPATPDNYFSSPGGLARLGLETAFYALQATDSQIFAGRATITNRRHLEPRWRRATFIAGLCAELHRGLGQLRVHDATGAFWQPYLQPLSDWLNERHTDRYQLRWSPRTRDSRPMGLFALPMIVPRPTMCYLAEESGEVVPNMLASIGGLVLYQGEHVLDQLVRHAAALVINRNLQEAGAKLGTPKLGVHLERYLVDAMRQLALSSSEWVANGARSRLWLGSDGLFMVWPNAMVDVLRLLEDAQLPGVPKSPGTALDVLIRSGVVVPRTPDAPTWTIHPPCAGGPLEAVRMASPDLILIVLTPSPSPLPMPLTRPPWGQQPAPAGAMADKPAAPHESGERSGAAVPVTPARTDATEVPAGAGTRAVPGGRARRGTGPQDGGRTAPAPEPGARQGKLPLEPVPRQEDGGGNPLALVAPLRLNPVVAAALRDILASHANGGDKVPCRACGDGLFIPLGELTARRLDAQIALRALREAGMLVSRPGEEAIRARDIDGVETLGLVLAARFISALPPERHDDKA